MLRCQGAAHMLRCRHTTCLSAAAQEEMWEGSEHFHPSSVPALMARRGWYLPLGCQSDIGNPLSCVPLADVNTMKLTPVQSSSAAKNVHFYIFCRNNLFLKHLSGICRNSIYLLDLHFCKGNVLCLCSPHCS